jgi:hypothetical protein
MERRAFVTGLVLAQPTHRIAFGGQRGGKTFDESAEEDTRIANEVRRRYLERLRYAAACEGEERRVSMRFGLIAELGEILGIAPVS